VHTETRAPPSAMRPQSAKQKGRKFQQAICADLLRAFPMLDEDDIRSTSMGAGGEDVLLSPRAQALCPYSFEAKNVERLNIHAAVEQSRANCGARTPCVVFRKNRTPPHACLPWPRLLELMALEERVRRCCPQLLRADSDDTCATVAATDVANVSSEAATPALTRVRRLLTEALDALDQSPMQTVPPAASSDGILLDAEPSSSVAATVGSPVATFSIDGKAHEVAP